MANNLLIILILLLLMDTSFKLQTSKRMYYNISWPCYAADIYIYIYIYTTVYVCIWESQKQILIKISFLLLGSFFPTIILTYLFGCFSFFAFVFSFVMYNGGGAFVLYPKRLLFKMKDALPLAFIEPPLYMNYAKRPAFHVYKIIQNYSQQMM
jgi:hypothetical protein